MVSQRSSGVFEYLASDTFWVHGIIIVVIAIWIDRQMKKRDDPNSEPRTGTRDEISDNDSPSSTTVVWVLSQDSWLRLYTISRIRKASVLLASLAVLAVQLREGYWVIKTAWRLTVVMLKATFPQKHPYILGLLLFLPALAILLAVWAAIFFAGFYLISGQIFATTQVYAIQLGSNLLPSYNQEADTHLRERDASTDERCAQGAAWDAREEQEELLIETKQ